MPHAFNIQFWKHHQSGGHLIALEQPDTLAADVAEFYGKSGPVLGKSNQEGESLDFYLGYRTYSISN
jgi:hypothetical protein